MGGLCWVVPVCCLVFSCKISTSWVVDQLSDSLENTAAAICNDFTVKGSLFYVAALTTCAVYQLVMLMCCATQCIWKELGYCWKFTVTLSKQTCVIRWWEALLPVVLKAVIRGRKEQRCSLPWIPDDWWQEWHIYACCPCFHLPFDVVRSVLHFVPGWGTCAVKCVDTPQITVRCQGVDVSLPPERS